MAITSGTGSGGKFEPVYTLPYLSSLSAGQLPKGNFAIASSNPTFNTASILGSQTPQATDPNAWLDSLIKALTGGGGSGGGGGGSAPKSDDSKQVAALKKMLSSKGFQAAYQTKINNIGLQYKETDANILASAKSAGLNLDEFREQNDKAESAGSIANLINQARENADLMEQAAAVGAGETDALRTAAQATRNWYANQQEIARSAVDTNTSINASIRDLNSSTKQARLSSWQAAQKDREMSAANYYTQMQDTYTQLGNIRANPNSKQYMKNSEAFDRAASYTGKSYEVKKAPSSLNNWDGKISTQRKKAIPRSGELGQIQAPSGAGLRSW